MTRLALALAALALAGCAGAPVTSETPTEVRIHLALGGSVAAAARFYGRHYTGEDPRRIVVDGTVVSADATFALGAPGACYTDRAVWQPHAASRTLGLTADRELTERLAEFMPPPLREWFLADHSSHLAALGVARVEADQLREIWPEGYCGEDV